MLQHHLMHVREDPPQRVQYTYKEHIQPPRRKWEVQYRAFALACFRAIRSSPHHCLQLICEMRPSISMNLPV